MPASNGVWRRHLAHEVVPPQGQRGPREHKVVCRAFFARLCFLFLVRFVGFFTMTFDDGVDGQVLCTAKVTNRDVASCRLGERRWFVAIRGLTS